MVRLGYAIVWYGLSLLCGKIWFGLLEHSVVVWFGLLLLQGEVWYGMVVWSSCVVIVWYTIIWYGLVWFGLLVWRQQPEMTESPLPHLPRPQTLHRNKQAIKLKATSIKTENKPKLIPSAPCNV